MATRNKSVRKPARARNAALATQSASINKSFTAPIQWPSSCLSIYLSGNTALRRFTCATALSYIADDVSDIQAIIKALTSA